MERYYFSYGSNLCQEQMKERCSTAFSIGKAVLSNYQLCFEIQRPLAATIYKILE